MTMTILQLLKAFQMLFKCSNLAELCFKSNLLLFSYISLEFYTLDYFFSTRIF